MNPLGSGNLNTSGCVKERNACVMIVLRVAQVCLNGNSAISWRVIGDN